MSLDRYRLLAQLGAGPDGIAYRAVAEDGSTVVEVIDLSRARSDAGRWDRLARQLRLADELEHTAALRVIELGLADDPPYAVVEWVGMATLAATVGTAGPKPRDQAIELARDLAGALAAAHRLGLAHGRLGPGQVLLIDGAQPKLDFTGTLAGFPAESDTTKTLDAACRDPKNDGGLTADRAADLYSLGSMLVWLMTGRTDRLGHEPSPHGLEAGSSLGGLVRRLLADDLGERPTAREVHERLAGLLAPTNATVNWENSGATIARPPLLARSDRVEPIIDRSGTATCVLEAGSPRLGRYRLLDKLGEGGQGVVDRAEDPADGSVVAIKILRTSRVDNSDVLRRFRKEARLMAEANNPYVVNLLEFNDEDGIPYMVLEFVAGEGLDRLLVERTRLDERTALAIMSEVAARLDAGP